MTFVFLSDLVVFFWDFQIAGYLCVGSCLDEVIVEEAVEDGVGAGGGDAQHVAEEEGEHHRLCMIEQA